MLLLLGAADDAEAALDLGDLDTDDLPRFGTGEGLCKPDLAALSSLFLWVRQRSRSTSFHRLPSPFLQLLQLLNRVG